MSISCGPDIGAETDEEIFTYFVSFYVATNSDKLSDSGMAKKIYHVQLTAQERTQLEMYVKQGKKSARAITRARIVLLSEAEHSDDDIMETLGICRQTIYNVQKK